MIYKIKYSYMTGDSFGSEDTEDILELEWENLDIAKEALKRIEEHYRWYESIESCYKEELSKPNWLTSGKNSKETLNLPLDNGKEFKMYCHWCGYFEKLYGAEIIEEDKDRSFVI